MFCWFQFELKKKKKKKKESVEDKMYVVPPPSKGSDPLSGSTDELRIYQAWKGSNVSYFLLLLSLS